MPSPFAPSPLAGEGWDGGERERGVPTTRFDLFWQTPGSEESSDARRHWETIEEIVLGEQLGFESAWLAESVFYIWRRRVQPVTF